MMGKKIWKEPLGGKQKPRPTFFWGFRYPIIRLNKTPNLQKGGFKGPSPTLKI